MFESLYLNPTAKSEEAKADKLITELYRYYVANTDKLPDTYKRFITEFDERPEQVVCDYIAGMSDQYSIISFRKSLYQRPGRDEVMYSREVIDEVISRNDIVDVISGMSN